MNKNTSRLLKNKEFKYPQTKQLKGSNKRYSKHLDPEYYLHIDRYEDICRSKGICLSKHCHRRLIERGISPDSFFCILSNGKIFHSTDKKKSTFYLYKQQVKYQEKFYLAVERSKIILTVYRIKKKSIYNSIFKDPNEFIFEDEKNSLSDKEFNELKRWKENGDI